MELSAGPDDGSPLERTVSELVAEGLEFDSAIFERGMPDVATIDAYLSDCGLRMRHQSLAAVTLEAVTAGHPLRAVMGDRQRRYVDMLATVCWVGDPTTVSPPIDRATRYWCLLEGLLALRALSPRFPELGTFAGPLRSMLGGTGHEAPGQEVGESPEPVRQAQPEPMGAEQRAVMADFERVLITGAAPRSLDDIGDLMGTPRGSLGRIFDSFEEFQRCFFAWRDFRMAGALRSAGPLGLGALYALSDWMDEELTTSPGKAELFILAIAEAMRADHPARTFHGRRVWRWYLEFQHLLWEMRRSGELRRGVDIEREALVFQALMLGLMQYALYFPGEIVVADQIHFHLATLVGDK